jgi:hypothetical protein
MCVFVFVFVFVYVCICVSMCYVIVASDVYMMSKLRRFMVRVGFLMENNIYHLVEDSLHAYTNFLLAAAPVSIQVVDTRNGTVCKRKVGCTTPLASVSEHVLYVSRQPRQCLNNCVFGSCMRVLQCW